MFQPDYDTEYFTQKPINYNSGPARPSTRPTFRNTFIETRRENLSEKNKILLSRRLEKVQSKQGFTVLDQFEA